MTKLLQLVLSGGVSGAIFAIVALGLVLTYASSGVFNFGHAGIAFATAYLYFELNTGLGWPTWIAAIASIFVFAPLLGLLLDRILFRSLATAPVYARVVGTIGLSIALPSLALWTVEQLRLLGANIPDNQQAFTVPGLGPTPPETWTVPGGAIINSDQVIVLACATLASLVFWILVQHTRLGLHMRAAVDRKDLAELRGVDAARVSSVAWMLSTMLAGLAGVCLGPFLGLSDISYTFVVFGAMGAVVVAKFRSPPLAIAGGIALGIISNLVAGYADEVLPDFLARLSGLRSAVPFMLTFIALLVLGRSKVRAGGTVAGEAPPPDLLVDMSRLRRWAPWVIGNALVIAYVLLVADDFWAGLFARGVIVSIIFLSFTVLTGLGGLISLGQAAFVTIGAFSTGWLTIERGWPFVFALLAAVAVTALVGALISLPLRRLGALELALATLSLAFVADLVLFQVESIRNGSTGYSIPPPRLGSIDLANARTLFIVVLIVFGLLTLAIRNLANSPTGRSIFAARSSDVAARSIGLSPDRSKVVLFSVSGAIAGLGGALYAVRVTPFTSGTTPPLIGLIWLAVLVTWGVRRPAGALVGGMTFVLLGPVLEQFLPSDGTAADLFTSSRFLPILFGLGAVNLAREPDGLLALGIAQRRAIASVFRRGASSESDEDAVVQASTSSDVGTMPLTTLDSDTATVSGDVVVGGRALHSSDGPPVLSVRGLCAGYGEIEVLHGIDLEVGRGEVVAVLGANGAGKSTLCAALMGLVDPRAGSISFDGQQTSDLSSHDRFRRGMTLTPERRGIFPGLTVGDNLDVMLGSAEKVTEALDQFPALANRRRQLAGSLSGGEQQLLALAPSLVVSPTLLIADEPSLGLAPLVTQSIWTMLSEMRSHGVSVLLVEEKPGDVLEIADRAVVINLGRIVWSGAADELDRATAAQAYFGLG